MISKLLALILMVSGLVMVLLGVFRVGYFVNIPELTMAGAVLVGAGVVSFALTERTK